MQKAVSRCYRLIPTIPETADDEGRLRIGVVTSRSPIITAGFTQANPKPSYGDPETRGGW
jgi:hypothetical protein